MNDDAPAGGQLSIEVLGPTIYGTLAEYLWKPKKRLAKTRGIMIFMLHDRKK
jgi:hypothetical protein